ncbi:probable insulin-like peptide 6 [Drosophila takahashii]|uniref:probable insulin-like peptide 6 n=1 Tax=Drosophila takahashii TaxID=29030 RepID=UPI0007E66508|nr:probable insulin-like peptide 6 [Drosophila takahashii]
MIPEVPASKILVVLATLVAVVTLISSWVPQVAGSPVGPTDSGNEQRRMLCSSQLTDVIQDICKFGTMPHYTAYPSGKRRKRTAQNVADLCCKPGGCSYMDLRNYCIPGVD